MNVYTQYYQECDELAILRSEREVQIVANFCMTNDINCQFEQISTDRWKCFVIKDDVGTDKYLRESYEHLQQCRDAISGILYAMRVAKV